MSEAKPKKYDRETIVYGVVIIVPMIGAYLWATGWVWVNALRMVVP